ncbi:ATPase, T2SS/T4P/T4SS family, partial [Escherichia coli]|nr:Flp pilus assembly complex ATPase component TadA [Escherichia coli]
QEMKLRFQSIAADRGPSVTMRVLEQNNIRPLEAYEYLPSHLALLVRHKGASNGLIVFAGKVGSGKTTSITALIATLPPHYKIFMIEDPVEIIVDNAIQCTVERKMDGSSDSSFKSKLFSMKRNAPDAVSLGEIRDPLTGNGVVEVGGMGTLGLFTIHAAGMLHIPERMWSDSIRIPKDFLASPGMLKLLVYQALVHRLCSCAEPLSSLVEKGGSDWNSQWHDGPYWEQYIARIQTMFAVDSSTMKVRNINGCEKCRHEHFTDLNGYNSRTVIAEMMEPNSHYEMLKLIAQGDTLGLYEFMDQLPRSPNSDPDMTNKNVVECGIYKALIGQVDPRDIERATESFESLVLQPRYAGKFQ